MHMLLQILPVRLRFISCIGWHPALGGIIASDGTASHCKCCALLSQKLQKSTWCGCRQSYKAALEGRNSIMLELGEAGCYLLFDVQRLRLLCLLDSFIVIIDGVLHPELIKWQVQTGEGLQH